jgi:hypothetical protein
MAVTIVGSGSITGLSAGGLPTGSVTADSLATNSVDSAELINGAIDSSHLASGVGGKVLQVVISYFSTATTTTSTSFANTGMSATITPSATSSKILVQCVVPIRKAGSSTAAGVGLQLVRVSTSISTFGTYVAFNGITNTYNQETTPHSYLDSPATTASTEYLVQFKVMVSSSTGYLCHDSSIASMTLFEIGA